MSWFYKIPDYNVGKTLNKGCADSKIWGYHSSEDGNVSFVLFFWAVTPQVQFEAFFTNNLQPYWRIAFSSYWPFHHLCYLYGMYSIYFQEATYL